MNIAICLHRVSQMIVSDRQEIGQLIVEIPMYPITNQASNNNCPLSASQ